MESGADCGRFFDSSAEWWKKVQIMFYEGDLGFVRGSHYLNDGKKDFGFHHSALESKNLPQSAPLSRITSVFIFGYFDILLLKISILYIKYFHFINSFNFEVKIYYKCFNLLIV